MAPGLSVVLCAIRVPWWNYSVPERAVGRFLDGVPCDSPARQILFGKDRRKGDGRWVGFVLSHPFANGAKGWGTPDGAEAGTWRWMRTFGVLDG